jgi:uncharacterized protein (DUF1015 family)
VAAIAPLHALRYDPRTVGSLDAVAAPPYDVIDDAQRAALAARSPFNVVELDLPRGNGGDPYLHAQTTMESWLQQGIVVRERQPTVWAMTQDYRGPDGRALTRRGFFCRVRVEDYGAGRIRPHERTHPGPKEDRLRLTRATRANLSPVFSLFADPDNAAWQALEPATAGDPFGEVADAEGTVHRVWRVADDDAVANVERALQDRELLIADGHHRYETARIYAQEVGGDGEHRWVLMFLCSLSDPGLTVFAIHRLLRGLDEERRAALRRVIERDFRVEEIDESELAPPADPDAISFGYLDAFHRRPLRLTLTDRGRVDELLADRSEAYGRLDSAVLEALVLRDALGMSDEQIAHLQGLDYRTDARAAREAVEDGEFDAAFFLRPTPVEQVREVAAAGESMPPKSTYFFPKVPTGIVFNPLE